MGGGRREGDIIHGKGGLRCGVSAFLTAVAPKPCAFLTAVVLGLVG